jgi:hypothetical protein
MREGIDTSLVGHVAAELMDQVSEQFGDNAAVETVAVVVEVRHFDGEQDATTITCVSSEPRAWAQSGLLSFAARLVERQALP